MDIVVWGTTSSDCTQTGSPSCAKTPCNIAEEDKLMILLYCTTTPCMSYSLLSKLRDVETKNELRKKWFWQVFQFLTAFIFHPWSQQTNKFSAEQIKGNESSQSWHTRLSSIIFHCPQFLVSQVILVQHSYSEGYSAESPSLLSTSNHRNKSRIKVNPTHSLPYVTLESALKHQTRLPLRWRLIARRETLSHGRPGGRKLRRFREQILEYSWLGCKLS